jgi:hypothetical protein
MRTLTDHTVNGDSAEQLDITVLDEPGAGGANHQYMISWGEQRGKPTIAELEAMLAKEDGPKPQMWPDGSVTLGQTCLICFQNGPIKEAGVNGITQEALLTVVIDRLRSLQAGPFSCRENAIALTHIEEALMWLQRRTVARIKRGVEGTNQK